MKKKWIFSTVGAVGAGALGYVLKDENRRSVIKEKAKTFSNSVKDSLQKNNQEDLPIEKAGVPETDHVENTKMVDEGSQFGVQYYNKVKQEDSEEKA